MGFITIVIYLLLSLIMGTFFVGLSLNLIDLMVISNYFKTIFLSDYSLTSPRVFFFLLGIMLILLCLRYVHAVFLRSRRNKTMNFEGPEGAVSISLFAIEEMLRKMMEERSEISHIRPKVCLKRKRIEVVARGILVQEVNLIEFAKEIQEKIKAKINSLLGEDKEVRVNLEIRKVALGQKGKLKEEAELEIPFRNYE